MKITESKLRQIIREEVKRSMLNENTISYSFPEDWLKETNPTLHTAIFIDKKEQPKPGLTVSEFETGPAVKVYNEKEKKFMGDRAGKRVYLQADDANSDIAKTLKDMKKQEEAYWQNQYKNAQGMQLQQVMT